MKNHKDDKKKQRGKRHKNERTAAGSGKNKKVRKEFWKAGNMLYPLPAVMVSCAFEGVSNIITAAWTGTVCTNPPMVYISLRPERYSYDLIKNSGEFVINLTNGKLTYAMDFCGVRSGRDVDKWAILHLTKEKGEKVETPLIQESPVNIECKVDRIVELGSHHMFLANVEGVHVNHDLIGEKGNLCLEKAGLIAYSHGFYHDLGKIAGSFGYSVKKSKKILQS